MCTATNEKGALGCHCCCYAHAEGQAAKKGSTSPRFRLKVVTEPFGDMYIMGQIYETLERKARKEKAKIDAELTASGTAHEWIGCGGGRGPDHFGDLR
jgi:hypothetical protein